jgi:FkbM family methyltransferase
VGRAAPPHVFTAEARDLFLYGYTPSPGDVVFDVGAGIGAETLLFSRLVGASGHVISLEAHPRTFRRLADLCNANTLANVTPLQVAASDAEGAVVISDRPAHAHNRLVVDGEGIEVRARPVEAIAAELGITRIDLLKMNIEGAEREAIRGVGALLANTHHVCISCHDFLGMPTKAEVRQFLTEHGFAVTAREDAREPWTRDYLYGVRQKPGVSVLKDGSFVGGVCKP